MSTSTAHAAKAGQRLCREPLRAHRALLEGTELEIWGQCPKCRRWFACDSWFDRSVPTPTCPDCALLPGVLRYERREMAHSAPGAHSAHSGHQRGVSELWLG